MKYMILEGSQSVLSIVHAKILPQVLVYATPP